MEIDDVAIRNYGGVSTVKHCETNTIATTNKRANASACEVTNTHSCVMASARHGTDKVLKLKSEQITRSTEAHLHIRLLF